MVFSPRIAFKLAKQMANESFFSNSKGEDFDNEW